jgi:hypothetical protein
MKPTTLVIALLSLTALTGCGSPSPIAIQPVATKSVPPPAPAAWAMVAGTAELPRPFGLALFSIADDDRRKVIYLQGYICDIRPNTAGCTP